MLFVCTGNICRSPLAERLGRAYLQEVLEEQAGGVRLASAGLQAVVGSGMHPDSSLVLEGLGGDSRGFRARQLVAAMAVGADLTLTMTRVHRREVLALAPRALSRTFTLPEAADLVRFVDGHRPRSGGVADHARALVPRLHAARSRRRSGPEDDIRDPIGLPPEAHQESGEAIAAALLPLLGRLAGVASPPDLTRSS